MSFWLHNLKHLYIKRITSCPIFYQIVYKIIIAKDPMQKHDRLDMILSETIFVNYWKQIAFCEIVTPNQSYRLIHRHSYLPGWFIWTPIYTFQNWPWVSPAISLSLFPLAKTFYYQIRLKSLIRNKIFVQVYPSEASKKELQSNNGWKH